MYQLDNLILFAAEKEHLAHITKWANDFLFKNINATKHKVNLKSIELELATKELLLLSMNKALAGFCEIYHIDSDNKTCYLNFYIENFSESIALYGFKVLKLICDYLFMVRGFNKISSDILLDDDIAINVFKQRGFKIEVHKRAHLFVNGDYKTVVELSLLRQDYK